MQRELICVFMFFVYTYFVYISMYIYICIVYILYYYISYILLYNIYIILYYAIDLWLTLIDSRPFNIFRTFLLIPQTELALWDSGAFKAGEGPLLARASAAMKQMILADVL